MAWDTDRTKQLLLDAATREFCDHGLAGARVDRIAERAGVNKERIYQYFGKKDELFDIVIARALGQLMEEVPLTGSGPEAVGYYAGRLFDAHVQDRTLARLLFWEGLERGGAPVGDAEREQRHRMKVDLCTQALPGISRVDAGELLMTIVSLCDSWVVLPQLDALLVRSNSDRLAHRRAAVVETVTLVADAMSARSRPQGGR